MQETDYEGFAKAWTRAWDLYGKPISSGAIDLSYEALQRYDLAAITRALTAHVNDPDTGQYPPKPADIVRLIDGRKEDRAQQAWTKVEHAARRVGHCASIIFDDPLIHAVISDMGGWIDICMTDEDELPFRAREFEKRYQGYLLGGRAPHYPRQLTGRIDQVNNATGYVDVKEPPMLIGDPEQAQAVLQNGGDGGALTFTRLSDLEAVAIRRKEGETK